MPIAYLVEQYLHVHLQLFQMPQTNEEWQETANATVIKLMGIRIMGLLSDTIKILLYGPTVSGQNLNLFFINNVIYR